MSRHTRCSMLPSHILFSRSTTIFAGRLYGCNDDTRAGKSDCINEYIASPVDPSLAFLAPRVWDNPNTKASQWNFDDFRSSLLILLETVSLEGKLFLRRLGISSDAVQWLGHQAGWT